MQAHGHQCYNIFKRNTNYIFVCHQDDAYLAVAKEFDYDVLGTATEDDVADFREDLGTLQQQRWKKLDWKMPDDEAKPCWWIVNRSEDKMEAPRLLSRSLLCLRLELAADRCASSLKLKLEWEKRILKNSRAVGVLHHHRNLWNHVAGPDPEDLLQPSSASLDEAKKASQCLQELIHMQNDEQNDQKDFSEKIVKAVDSIKQVSWDAIRKEKFSMTPVGLFDEMVRNAEARLNRQAGEAERRKQRLAAIDKPEIDDTATEVHPDCIDRFGLNLDEFKSKSSRKPCNWQRAVIMASEIHLDEMRTLLELHYDDVHMNKWKHENKKCTRDGSYKIFHSVAQTHRKRLNQKITLPKKSKMYCKSQMTSSIGTNFMNYK